MSPNLHLSRGKSMKFQQQTGVTLIELMITVAVIAVISAIAVPLYTGYITSARNTEGLNNLAAIQLAQEEYYLENNSYFDGADTAEVGTNSAGLWSATGSDGVINFAYSVSSSTSGYTATATGRGGTYKVPDTVVLKLSK
jgi:type IV pilus assembly protein PilE